MSQTTKIIFTILVIACIIGGGFYSWENQKTTPLQPTNENSSSDEFSILTIMVPEDDEQYKQAMTEFVQAGGQDPLPTTTFIPKEFVIPHTEDLIRASAQAAAQEIPPGGGPQHASIAYFTIQNDTAYVLLDIDLNGWAGVSVSIAIIHPLVEKTLLQFPEITKVVFDYAPENKPS